MTLLSKLISMQHSETAKGESNGCSCEACGRVFENPIRLTNFSAAPMQIYKACPFCFSKLEENVVPEEPSNLKASTPKDASVAFLENQKDVKSSEQTSCPHHFGYLKNRPKNTQIPDVCLTCEKMIKCLLE